MKESWQPVPGYTGLYEVSDQGRVRSLDRSFVRKVAGKSPGVVRLKGRVLKSAVASNGYETVSLWSKNKGRSHCMHVLVAQAFIGDTAGRDVNHIDGDKLNNVRSNLEICTRSQNMFHAYRSGLWNGNRSVKNSKACPQPHAAA